MRPGDLFSPDNPVLGQLDRLNDGWGEPLPADHPQYRLLHEVARDLLAAGFELHDCGRLAPTGGVCLTPCGRGAGVMVTWAQHDVLVLGGELYDVYTELQELMNFALAEVLSVMGWRVAPSGHGLACVVVGRLADV